MNFAKEYYKNILTTHEDGRSIGLSYFRERGFNDRTIEKFELGFALEGWENFSREAIAKGYNKDLLEKTGLVVKREDGSSYDRFRGRVIFPVHNISGKVIAFGARMLGKDKNQPKYINSPETDIYHKSDVLYGLYQAKNAIRQHDVCYLVEGYTDVISMHQADVENVVASSGTALTENQIKLIHRFTENVTVLFDGDSAGIKAALRGIDMILKGGLNVRVVLFPDGEDPDSYSRKVGTTAFHQFLKEHTQDFVSFKANLFEKETLGDPIKRAEVINDILVSISTIPNYIKRTSYLQEVSRIFNLSFPILNTELNKVLIKDKSQVRNTNKEIKNDNILTLSDVHELSKSFIYDSEKHLMDLEAELIKVLLNIGFKKDSEDQYVYEYLFYETEDVDFVSVQNSEIIDLYKIEVTKGNPPTIDTITRIVPHNLKGYIASIAVSRYTLSKGWNKHNIYPGNEYETSSCHLVVSRLKLGVIQRMIDDGLKKLQIAETKDEQDSILETQMLIESAKKDISQSLGRVVLRMSKDSLN
jgi:DNA primase